MPWLTLITLICLGILISLGTWQYQRLEWKTNLLVEIDTAANAAPLTDINEMARLYADEHPLDFRRIEVEGEFIKPTVNAGQPFHLMMSNGKSMFWRLFQPFQTSDGIIYVATKSFTDKQKNKPPLAVQGPQSIVGYVRLVRKASSMQPKSNPETNNWFIFNGAPDSLNWARAVKGTAIPLGYYIDQIADAESAAELPVKKPELRNHHLDYMLTWYSFALILVVIYFLLHKKHGRLQFGTKNA
jgi:surfeit locus 1 family protein